MRIPPAALAGVFALLIAAMSNALPPAPPFGGRRALNGWLWPMGQWYTGPKGKFGLRIHPIDKVEKMHLGVDMGAPLMTPVYAAGAGRVTVARALSGYGNVVYLDHGNGTQTRYAHLYAFDVAEGATVRAGQLIGRCGSTGHSTGPHVHFEFRQRAGADWKAIDPVTVLGPNPFYAGGAGA